MTAYATEESVERLADKVTHLASSTGEAIGSIDQRVDLVLDRQTTLLELMQEQSKRSTELLVEQQTLRENLRDVEQQRSTDERKSREHVATLELEIRNALRNLSSAVVVLSAVVCLLVVFEAARDFSRRGDVAAAAERWRAGPPPQSADDVRTWWAEGLIAEPVVVVIGGDGGLSGCVDDDDDETTRSLRCVIYAQGPWRAVIVDGVTLASRGLYLPLVAEAER